MYKLLAVIVVVILVLVFLGNRQEESSPRPTAEPSVEADTKPTPRPTVNPAYQPPAPTAYPQAQPRATQTPAQQNPFYARLAEMARRERVNIESIQESPGGAVMVKFPGHPPLSLAPRFLRLE